MCDATGDRPRASRSVPPTRLAAGAGDRGSTALSPSQASFPPCPTTCGASCADCGSTPDTSSISRFERAALVPSAPVAVVLDPGRRRLIVTGGSRASRWTRSRRWPRRSTPGARTGFRKSFLKALGCAWRSSCEQGQTASGSTVLVRDVVVRHAGPAEEPDRWNRRSRRDGRPCTTI